MDAIDYYLTMDPVQLDTETGEILREESSLEKSLSDGTNYPTFPLGLPESGEECFHSNPPNPSNKIFPDLDYNIICQRGFSITRKTYLFDNRYGM